MNTAWLILFCASALHWQHPAGLNTADTLVELRDKRAAQAWAQREYDARKRSVEPWVSVSAEDLRRVFPKTRGNVYHNFSCPDDRTRLHFDPFNPRTFHCDTCGKDFSPDADAGIYKAGDMYHGTMYDGWACLFYLTASSVAMDMALIGRMDDLKSHLDRAAELLRLFAETIHGLPTVNGPAGDKAAILTYHREGDNKVLNELAQAYELLRDRMNAQDRARVEDDVLKRMLNDVMWQPEYTFDHNNIYQFHRTILQTALALERDDLVDWSFGYGDYGPDRLPEHRSLQRIVAKHFKPDGAFWELCSGYHLYPMDHFCELAVLSRNLSRMDPDRFPADRYDLTSPNSPAGKVIKAALEWFVSMAMPDRTMTVIGDSMAPRAGMDSYATTAEVGYRYFDVRAVGDYESLRNGKRGWTGFRFGAPEIVQQPTPFTSSYLSSGWVALRNEAQGNRVWVGLNALIPGGGHQHADRLSLTLYSQGKLLALEKATPYNEAITHDLGRMSQSHNTVTVDQTSQKGGSTLTGNEIPEVTAFASGPFLKFAELRADHLYPQAEVYRRSVAIIEDVVLDCFRVTAGKTHDWIVNHAGPAPTLSVQTEQASFDPAAWIAHGAERVRHAAQDGPWEARWTVDDVTSRLTMLGSPSTHVYALETYPIDNAVVTATHPACQTLCVRRTDNAPFLAVWDAWRDAPNLESVARVPNADALYLKTKSNAYYVMFGPGTAQFPDGVTLTGDACFSVLRNRDALAFVAGTRLEVMTPEAPLKVRLNQTGNLWADWTQLPIKGDKTPCIEYDTYAGEDHRRDSAALSTTFEGAFMPPHS